MKFKVGDIIYYDVDSRKENIITAPGLYKIVTIDEYSDYIISEYNRPQYNPNFNWVGSERFMKLANYVKSPLYKTLTKDVK